MKFDKQLRPATETSWLISYGVKQFQMADGRHFENCYIAISRWKYISAYLSEKSSDFDEFLYTAADFELDERHMIKNETVAFNRLRVRQNVFLVYALTRRTK